MIDLLIVPPLSCNFICVMLRLVILIQYWSVTDSQTHAYTMVA